MAAVTVNSSDITHVVGDLRLISANITGGNGDTWLVPGISKILGMSGEPTTNASMGFTFSGATITIASGGSLSANMLVLGV